MRRRGAIGPSVATVGAVACLTFAGCAGEAPPAVAPLATPTSQPAPTASGNVPPSSPPPPPPSSTAPTGGLPAAKLGEMCGGFAGIPCASGLVCGNVMPVADGSGTCRKANGAP